jgi:hypothetical protein
MHNELVFREAFDVVISAHAHSERPACSAGRSDARWVVVGVARDIFSRRVGPSRVRSAARRHARTRRGGVRPGEGAARLASALYTRDCATGSRYIAQSMQSMQWSWQRIERRCRHCATLNRRPSAQ